MLEFRVRVNVWNLQDVQSLEFTCGWVKGF